MPATKKKPAAKESNAIVQQNAETPDEPALDADASAPVQPEDAENHDEPVIDADAIMNQITDSEGNIKLDPYSGAKAAALNAALAKPNLKELDIKLDKFRASLPDKSLPRRVLQGQAIHQTGVFGHDMIRCHGLCVNC